MRNRIIIFIFLIIVNKVYSQDYPKKFNENQKWGVSYKEKVIFPAVYDYVSVNFVIVTKKDGEINVYDLDNFQLLYSNIKAFEYSTMDPDPYTIQIITKENLLKIYDDDGIVNDYSKFQQEEESSAKKWGSFKTSVKVEEKYFVNNHQIIGAYYDARDSNKGEAKGNYSLDYKLIKRGRKPLFLNNKEKLEITNYYSKYDSIELDYSEEKLFTPLKYTYVIAKVKGKYGVWDFKDEKTILPFEYDKIISHQKYLLLNKNGMLTFYPNIGTEPKYKKLEPYIGYFARFETIDGKKGWVDRKGKEYFDE